MKYNDVTPGDIPANVRQAIAKQYITWAKERVHTVTHHGDSFTSKPRHHLSNERQTGRCSSGPFNQVHFPTFAAINPTGTLGIACYQTGAVYESY